MKAAACLNKGINRFLSIKRSAKSRLLVLAVVFIVGILAAYMFPPAAQRVKADAPTRQGLYDAKSSFYQAGVTASDINGDGVDELLVGNQNGALYCFDPNAKLIWKYDTKSKIQGTPACVDVDGDGKQEVWVGDMNGRMWGFDYRGQPLSKWGWPRQTISTGGITGIFSSPAVGDMNADGKDEIVVGTYGQYIYAWAYTGELLPGWPYNNEDTIWSSPALADIDWDGVKEVVIGADSTGGANWPYPAGGLLYVLDEDGSVLPGFPRWTNEVTWSSPAVADIDKDGRYEIIVGSGLYYTKIGKLTNQSHEVYGYNHDGTDISEDWPVTTVGSSFSSPSLGDVDGDGAIEIVIGTCAVGSHGSETVTVIDTNGIISQVITGHGGPTLGSPALADVSGDGVADILLGSGQRFYAWDGNGTPLWPFIQLDNYVVGNPAAGDFDRDGSIEVAFATGDEPEGSFTGGKFFVYDCGTGGGTSAGAGSSTPWPFFRHTVDHHATILTGKEPPAPGPPAACTWYLAEGSTADGLETWVLVQNPGSKTADVKLTYMTADGPVAGPSVKLGPHQRCTFNAAETVPNQYDVSTMVESDKDVIAERAVYGNNRSWATDSVGVSAAKTKWYLAEGSTGPGMETWVLVQNPNRTAANVSLTFQTDAGLINGPGAAIPAYSRKSFNLSDYVPNYWGVSTMVESDKGVVAERAMYGNGRTWATDSIGTNLAATSWYMAEGCTGGGMETWLLIQNPKHPDANVHIDYMTSEGKVSGPSFSIKAGSRKTVYAGDTVKDSFNLSALITSDIPVIAERSMYGNDRLWGTDSIGVPTPRQTWYLAEGSTGPGMETWITVQNPNTGKTKVNLTYMTPDGAITGPSMNMEPESRATFHVADYVPNTWEVSTTVTADKPVIAERAMYGNDRTWAHESIGFAP